MTTTQPTSTAPSRNTSALPLAGKVALVTGGARGTGAAIVERLAHDGAAVAFTYAGAIGSALRGSVPANARMLRCRP